MRELAQADPTHAELAIHRARAAAPGAARVGPHLILGLPLLLGDERLLGHVAYCSLLEAANGKPRAPKRARPCSSDFADVVIAISSPRIDGTWS